MSADDNSKAPRRAGRGAENDGGPLKTDNAIEENSANSSGMQEAACRDSSDARKKAPIIRLPFPDNVREAADEYLSMGMVPIPLNRCDEGNENEKGKKPKLKGYRKKIAEDIDVELREEFWGSDHPANIGLVLQRAHVVIDLDSKKDGGRSAEEWQNSHPDLAAIPKERTNGGFHLHYLCPDLPELTNKSGTPLGRSLVSQLEDRLTAELIFCGLPVTVAPSTHKSGNPYSWVQGGELPEISWKRLREIFGFREPSLESGDSTHRGMAGGMREIQKRFGGDLETLDIVKLFKIARHYGEVIDADECKHSVRCPFAEEHSDHGAEWTSADTSAVIYEGGQRLPGFHCLHSHCDGRSLADVLKKYESVIPGLVDKCCEKPARPRIELPRPGRPELAFASDVAGVLADTGEVFLYGGRVVEVREMRELSTPAVKLHPLEPREAVTAFEKHIEFVKSVKIGKDRFELVPSSITKPEILLAASPLQEALPVIDRVLSLPVPLLDGEKIVLPGAGYDPRFRTYVDPNAPRPLELGLSEAFDVLEDLLSNKDRRGFAWKDTESEIAAISRLLTPYCRGLMGWKKTPVFLIVANQPRVGKDTVAYVCIVLYTGVEPTSPPLGKENDDEMRKRITSALLAGARFIHFPNMKGKIDFPSLEAATDASCVWRDRLLGVNKEAVLPNEAEYSLSANIGAEWSVDLDGRAVIIRLHYSGENVNRREFRHPDIIGHVRQNRRRILGALDALVRNWDEKGRPSGPTPHASFPEWATIVGGIMHAANLGDPCLRAPDLQGVTGDSETEDMRKLFRLGHERHGNSFIGKTQLYKLVQSNENAPFGYLELDTQAGKTSFGRKLKKFEDRELSGITLKINDSDPCRLRYAFFREDEGPTLQTSQALQTSAKSWGAEESEDCSGESSAEAADNKTETACEVCDACMPTSVSLTLVETEAELDQLLQSLPEESAPIALDIETFGTEKRGALDPWKGKIRLLQLAFTGGEPFVIDVQKIGKTVLQRLFERLGDHLLVGHNLAFDLAFLGRHYGFRPKAVFCTMTASRLLSAGDRTVKHGLEFVAKRYLGFELEKGYGDSDWSGSLSRDQLAYAALDVAFLLPLREELKSRLKETSLTRTAQLEMRMVTVALEMRLNGLQIDVEELEKIRTEAEEKREEHKARIASIAGSDLNPNSPIQLKEMLCSLGVELPDTKEDTLKSCGHGLAEAILDYRKSNTASKKAKELERFFTGDGRVHPEFDPMAARTGRFSASHPNVQNLPRGAMRKVICAKEGCKLIAADYSQIELRAAAVIAREERMLEAFRGEQDLHAATASSILSKPIEEVSAEERRLAKAVNFGLLFGQNAKGLVGYAEKTYNVSISLPKAQRFRDAFFCAYPALKAWHDRMRQEANDKAEEARTLFGRRRLIPAESGWWQRFATLVNTPVQGTATDGMKLALWELYKRLPNSAKLVSMIHDEVIVEVEERDADAVEDLVKKVMVEAMSKVLPDIPIEVEVNVGQNWAGDET